MRGQQATTNIRTGTLGWEKTHFPKNGTTTAAVRDSQDKIRQAPTPCNRKTHPMESDL